MSAHETFAAVDLGSNSFHLVIAQLVDGELKMVDKLKERVQLAAGLDDRDYLNEAAQMRALADDYGNEYRDYLLTLLDAPA